MPFPQHLDRTARVAGEKLHPVPSMLVSLQTTQRHWPSILRFIPQPKRQQPSLLPLESMLNYQTYTVNSKRTECSEGTTSKHSFLANHFRYYLTLFSKFFSPFLHSTCSLSLNRRYLVLDGVYHPLRAAIPSNPTRREHIMNRRAKGQERDYHPL